MLKRLLLMSGNHITSPTLRNAVLFGLLVVLTMVMCSAQDMTKAQGQVNGTAVPAQGSQSQAVQQDLETADQVTLTSGIEPKLNENFVWSGLISSNIDSLPSADEDQESAVILPLREDGGLYSGILTYQSNSPVSVTVWDRITATNQTSLVEDLGDDLGEIEDLAVMDGMTVAPIIVASGTSGSVPFIGNALELVGDAESPFVTSYAINATVGLPQTVDDLSSLGSFATDDEADDEADDEEEE